MKYKLTNGKNFEINSDRFMKIAQFSCVFGNKTLEVVTQGNELFYISEPTHNRFVIIQLVRKSEKEWDIGFRTIQSDTFHIRPHQDEIQDNLKTILTQMGG